MKNQLTTLPNHIAIIMDGNGRWAKSKGLQRIDGHKQGAQVVREIIEYAAKIGIKYLSLFAFSTENWQRPATEVEALMQLLIQSIQNHRNEIHKNDIRLVFIGDLNKLPIECYKSILEIMEQSKNNNGLTVCVALSYSGKWDILQATKRIIEYFHHNNASIDILDEKMFSSFLSTANLPDPDLLIRTSGETRISNFYLWQSAYCELYFVDKFWPDFTQDDLKKAIEYYALRERRFGKTSEQLQ